MEQGCYEYEVCQVWEVDAVMPYFYMKCNNHINCGGNDKVAGAKFGDVRILSCGTIYKIPTLEEILQSYYINDSHVIERGIECNISKLNKKEE